MSHTKWYQQGKIDRKEYENLEYLKRRYPNLYKAREKYIGNVIKRRERNAKRMRKQGLRF